MGGSSSNLNFEVVVLDFYGMDGKRMKFIVGLLMFDIGSNPLTLWDRLVTVLMYMCELLRRIVSVSMNATSPWEL